MRGPLNLIHRLKALAHGMGLPRRGGIRPALAGTRLSTYEAIMRAQRNAAPVEALDYVHFPLDGPSRDRDGEGRPLPPLALARRIGAPTFAQYEAIGQATRRTIQRCLPPDFSFEDARVLDFGCGVARVLRHFAKEAETGEFWGCDIDGRSIRWDVENLSPPFRFFQISEVPTIPLEDASFDLVYAISVFSHIHADWHHWLMELRRILKPGGYCFVTFLAQTPFEEMVGQSYWDHAPAFGNYVQNPFADWNDGGPTAYLSPDWVKTFWSSLFDIEFIALDGLLDYQSICLMRKPVGGPLHRTIVPVLRNASTQTFDPDAVGRIVPAHDETRPYRESYGIEAHGPAEINGWIVFRNDTPAGLEVRVDGTLLAADASFAPDAPYRDWADTILTAFSAGLDVSGLAPGEHRLDVLVRSTRGKTHSLSIPLIVRAEPG